MKNAIFSFLILNAVLMYSPSVAETTLIFKFKANEIGKIKYFNIPLDDGRFFYLNLIKEKVDENGMLRLKLKLKKPGIVNFAIPYLLEIYLEPGANMLIDLTGSTPMFKGTLSEENHLITRFGRRGHSFATDSAFYPDPMKVLSKLATSRDFFERLEGFIKADFDLLDDLSGDISSGFLGFIKEDIKLYYYDIAFASLLNKYPGYFFKENSPDSSIINSEWGNGIKIIADKILKEIEDEAPQSSQRFFSCLYDFIVRYKVWFLKENVSGKILLRDAATKVAHDLFIGPVPLAVEKYLSNKNKEFFVPNFLSYYITGNVNFYSNEMINYSNVYARSFSNSIYLKPLKARMVEVTSFLEGLSNPSASGVIIIPNFSSIDYFQDLLHDFKGQVLYVDIWATWCGPCIKEFNHNKELLKLKEDRKDFNILYISRDNMADVNRWEKFIFAKNLRGYHLIPNDHLISDLRENVNWNEIPRYLIIDKLGRIVNNDAPAPSSGKAVLDEINKYLNEVN